LGKLSEQCGAFGAKILEWKLVDLIETDLIKIIGAVNVRAWRMAIKFLSESICLYLFISLFSYAFQTFVEQAHFYLESLEVTRNSFRDWF
jgi:hypothetical protein